MYVKKYADFSSRFGMGYILSNNVIGVLFNDNSSFFYVNPDKLAFIYRVSSRDSAREKILYFTAGSMDEDLRYKYEIFKEFES